MAISSTHIKQLQLGNDEYYISAKYLLDNSNLEHSYEDIKQLIDEAAALHNLEIKVVTTLPTASADTMNAIYLVAEAGTQSGTYVEYITVRSGSEGAYTYAWEKIGTTATDLSEYSLKTHIHTVTPNSISLSATASGTTVGASSTAAALGSNATFSASGTSINTTNAQVLNSWTATVNATTGVLSFSTGSTNALVSASINNQPTITVSNKDEVSAITAVSVTAQPTIKINNEASVNVAAATQVNTSADTSN